MDITKTVPFSIFDVKTYSLVAIENLYIQFLGYFPPVVQPIVSLVLAALIVYSVFRVVRKDFVFIIALIVLVPGSVPILESIWTGILMFLKFLLHI